MYIHSHNYQIHSGLNKWKSKFHKKSNAIAEDFCYRAENGEVNLWFLLQGLSKISIPVNITDKIWSTSNGNMIEIHVGTEGTIILARVS